MDSSRPPFASLNYDGAKTRMQEGQQDVGDASAPALGDSSLGDSTSEGSTPSTGSEQVSLPPDPTSANSDGAESTEDALTHSPEFLAEHEIFDPKEVYLFGTLSEGACYRDAVANPLTPDQGSVGFDCNADDRSARIRPTDGRLLYMNSSENVIREFHCDRGCSASTEEYPEDPLRNDPILPAAGCTSDQVRSFDFSPDGTLYHVCYQETVWRTEAGDIVLDTRQALLAFHDGGVALTMDTLSGLSLYNLNDPEQPPLTIANPEGRDFLAARATSGGFWLAYSSTNLNDTPARFMLTLEGSLTQLDTYGLPPEGFYANGAGVLDASGRFWQEGSGPETFQDVILRREPAAELAEVVYDEANDPLVKIHISSLFTGASQ